jgi:hypothetical protein
VSPAEILPGDDLADAIALCEVIRRDDEHTVLDIKSVLRNGNMYGVAVTLAKLLAAVCDEQEIDPVHMRRWAADAVNRP